MSNKDMNIIKKNLLNNKWIIWIHNLHDRNWDKSSYKMIYEFNSIENF